MSGDQAHDPRSSVLIVEDNGLIALRLKRILTKLKYDVVGMVASGEEAIRIAGEMRPDLVLMDIYLAGKMKGTESAAQIRTEFDIPAVYLTAYAEDSLLEQAKAAGPYGYLIKPVQERELYTAIEMAIYKHEIDKNLRQRNRELALLNQAGQAFNSTLDLDQILTTVLEEACHFLDVFAASIWLIDASTGELVCHQATGLQNQVIRGRRLPPGEGIAGLTVQSGESVIVPDAQTYEHYYQDVEQQVELTLHSIISVPLQVKENVIGVFQMVDTKAGRFDAQDLTFLDPLAASAATAIENARLYKQAQQEIAERERTEKALEHRMDQLTALSQVSQVVTSSLELDLVLAQIVSLVGQVTASDYTSVVLQDEAGYIGKSTQDLPGVPSIEYRVRKKGLTSWIVHSRTPVIIGKVGQDGTIRSDLGTGAPHRVNPSIVATGIKSVAGLPLITKDYVLGVLYLHSLRPNAFRDQLDALTTFANQAAAAIENARLYEAVQQELVERMRVEEEQEQLLAQIQGQAQRMQQVMDTVPEGVLLLDAEGQVILSNPEAKEHTLALADARVGDGLTHLGGRPLVELLAPPSEGLWHDVVADSQIFQVIARPISGTAETGSTAGGWVLVIRKVTQEREIQQRIQQQERLATVGQMAAGIAHDFNNIMATITLYAQMLSRTPELSSTRREQLSTINQQALHASNLIDQILDFSRRALLERRPLDLRRFLKQQVKLLERTLPENVKVRLHYGADEYTVNADPTRMQQIFMNLAVNARDAMPEGGDLHFKLERIRIENRSQAPLPEMEVGEWVWVTGSDTGTGIPPDVLPHIYDPFFTTKAPGKGSGLGLAQVHGIVGAHEGYIDVESQVGQGTTFGIYLPALPIHAPDTPTLETPTLPTGQGETILVVEDNPATQQALVDSLELLNYQLLTAINGQEALQIIEQRGDEITLVVSDVVMPEMGGIALLHALRERGQKMSIILLTGHPLEEELEKLYTQSTNESGAALHLVGWLSKPPSLEQLAEMVAQGINAHRQNTLA